MADRAVNLETVIGMVNTYFRNVLNLNPDLLIDGIVSLPTVDAVPVDDVFALAIALNKEIEVLGLSVRAYHALSRWACRTVGDVYRLLKSGEIKKVRNLGNKSIGEIEDRLNAYLRRAEGEHGQTD